jgi:hypothetical protein
MPIRFNAKPRLEDEEKRRKINRNYQKKRHKNRIESYIS